MSLIERFGPRAPGVSAASVTEAEARAYVAGLATTHYENFSVLTRLVPERLREPFAAVYAFCRWSDDLGDETGHDEGARSRSTALLTWWRGELDRCYRPGGGEAEHPVFIALLPVIRAFRLPHKPFADLIDAFQQDQRVTRYETWDQLTDYCARSANPVGRLVLMLAGYREDEPAHATLFRQSDAVCTALQLINFWQDVRRDLVERDRVYIPSRDTGVTAQMLRQWMSPPGERDPACRIAYIHALRPLVERTRALFTAGEPLPGALSPEIRPVVWLFLQGGLAITRAVERAGCTTLWQRPRLSRVQKLGLVARAVIMKWSSGRSGSLPARQPRTHPADGRHAWSPTAHAGAGGGGGRAA